MSNQAQYRWMIYGAYGLTGRLVVEEARRRGHRPVLAGRDPIALNAMAEPLGLEARAFSLDEPLAVLDAASSTDLIVNTAGPFAQTGPRIIAACLKAGTAYLDIAGEFHHLRAVEALDAQARNANVPLLPGAGFGVTFGDGLARYVVDRLPDATHLRLSVAADNAHGGLSVRRTVLDVLAKGGCAVENGVWVRRPLAHHAWAVKDGSTDICFGAAPLGELAAVRRSTNVANIVVGRPMSAKAAKQLRLLSPLITTALGVSALRETLARREGKASVAPGEPKQNRRSKLWAEARNASGERVMAQLETGEGYAFTARAALANIEALLTRRLAGAFTPAQAFGARHVLAIEGVTVTDLDPKSSFERVRV